jgi:hypothetical protein
MLIYIEQISSAVLGQILGKTTQAASMQMNRIKKKLTAEGFVLPSAGTTGGEENTTGEADEANVSPKETTPKKTGQITGKAKGTGSGKERQAVDEKDKADEGEEDSGEKKTSGVKKLKLTLGKGEAGGRDGNE